MFPFSSGILKTSSVVKAVSVLASWAPIGVANKSTSSTLVVTVTFLRFKFLNIYETVFILKPTLLGHDSAKKFLSAKHLGGGT